jgi:hypothetical protein
MEKVSLQLYKARDADEAFGLRFPREDKWLARTGFGSDFEPIWTLEIQSAQPADRPRVDWENVLNRAVEAYRLSDPVITNFDWPALTT